MNIPNRNLHWFGMAGVVLVATLLTAALFWPMLADPNDHFVQAGGDALLSYYTTAFYVLHDHGLRFTGMNYPFGEHLNYPSLQPLLAVGMSWLQRHGVAAGRYTVGIVNVVALSSLVITPAILYAILRRTRLPVLYSGLLALIIGFMAPQVLRLDAHLALSYSWFVAWTWYCIIRLQEAPQRWRWYGVFGVSMLLLATVMPYFLALGCFFLLAHGLVLAWQQPGFRPWLWRLMLVAVLPLLLFRGFLWLTDPVTDRPPNPYGLLVYVASPYTLLTPALGPLHDWWQRHWPQDYVYEGAAYLGLVAAGALLAGTAGALRARLAGRPPAAVTLPLHLRTGLWAAGLLLLLAFGYPFKWRWLDGLTDLAGPIKQFRSLGRFAWPFYFVASTYAAYALYQLARRLRRRGRGSLAGLGLAAALLLWATEAGVQAVAVARLVTPHTGARDFLSLQAGLAPRLTWTNRAATDFQAIMPLPYQNAGTDKVDLGGSGAGNYLAYQLAATTGLPLLSSYIARASVSEAMQHVQLLSSDLIPKTLLARLPNRKPILLLVVPEALSAAEQGLVARAHLLVRTPEAALYELPLAALEANALPQERARAAALLPDLPVRTGGLRVTTPAGVIVQGYDDAPDRRGRLGAGAFYNSREGFSTIYDGPLPLPADTGRYEASVWMYSQTAYGFGNMQIKQYDAAGQELDHQTTDARLTTEVLDEWVRVVVPFRRAPQATRLEVLYDNRDLLVDDLLVRPVGTDVYYYTGAGAHRQLVKNTYPLTP